MINESILKYVQQMREKGISDENIKQALMAQGYSESDVLGSLWRDANEDVKKAPKKKRKPAPLFAMLITLAIFWVAALLYTRVWNPPWNPMPPIPWEFINTLPF